jgi:hypothetical protein
MDHYGHYIIINTPEKKFEDREYVNCYLGRGMNSHTLAQIQSDLALINLLDRQAITCDPDRAHTWSQLKLLEKQLTTYLHV